ncbi:MAG: class I SAM-dependent methyltransferase [Candidatus Woesearchaeota archaeon]|nr:class I SAM-dependent methyltransferase [Candidatus Woesearchaeota archaeon]
MDKSKLKEIELHDKLSNKYENIRLKNKNGLYYNKIWSEKILDKISKDFNNVLDYGCGTCTFYKYIISKYDNTNYIGTDISFSMINVGKKEFKNINVAVADGEKLPFKNNSFDLIIGRGILHHLINPEKGIKELSRILKGNKQVIFSEPNNNILLSIPRFIAKKTTKHFTKTHKDFKRKELIKLFQSNGFKIRSIENFGYFAFPFGLPDIMPILRLMPFSLFKILIKIDKIISKIPYIKILSWHTIILAEKE